TSDTVYKMSADWQVMHTLEGKHFLADTRSENRTWMENYIPEPERPRVAGAIADAIRHKRMFELEHQVIDAAGNVAWVYSRAVPQLDEKGEITGWFGAASNITLRKRAEAQLREFTALLEKQVAGRTRELQESRDLLQSVFDTSLLSISVLEAVRDESGRIEDFRIKMVNRNIVRATGRTDLTGMLFARAFPGTRSVGLFDRMRQVMETGQPAGLEYHYSYEGINKWYSSLFARLEDGLVLTTLDITQLKQMEEENIRIRLEQQQALLNAILEAQEEERRRISESLHNGVGQILCATKLSLASLEPDDPADRQPRAAEALQKTDALLTEAIVETRRVSHELMPILLKDFGLKQAIGEFCNRFAGTGIRLECHCFPERLPALLEMAIYRISQELVNNIVKHSGATRAVVEVSKDQAFVYLDVQDNGKGMAREEGTGAYPPGKGIGLRTIRDRVKLLGGTVEIDAEPGKRTEIFICLPLPPDQEPAGAG
ncbi:MAG TPA: ATP-binding protein, partial [Cytophagales bacterium]